MRKLEYFCISLIIVLQLFSLLCKVVGIGITVFLPHFAAMRQERVGFVASDASDERVANQKQAQDMGNRGCRLSQ